MLREDKSDSGAVERWDGISGHGEGMKRREKAMMQYRSMFAEIKGKQWWDSRR